MGLPDTDSIIKVLEDAGPQPYIYHHKGGSAYIKFRVNVTGTLRISNHPQRSRYHYRWNLRSDYAKFTVKEGDAGDLYYYPAHQVTKMVEDMKLVAALYSELPAD